MNCSLPGSSVHGIFQTGILEWVLISFSKGSFWPRDQTHVSCSSCIAGRFFTTESSGKPCIYVYIHTHTYVYMYIYIHTHTVEYYSATREKAILLFTTTWMELEGISVQFGSVTQLCMILCDPMDCSMPGFPAHHKLLELVQTHVHWVSDAIQTSHPLLSPSPHALNLSQYQRLFQWIGSFIQVAKILELQLQHWSFQWMFRTDFL